MSFTISIKNAGKIYDIELKEDAKGSDFKQKIQDITQIPMARQKILVKGGKLTDEVLVSSLTLNSKVPIMVLGSPDKDLPTAEVKKQVFLEDLSDKQLGKVTQDPSGLVNLGNTCYLNSSLQAIYNMSDISKKVKEYEGTANPLVKSLKSVFTSMDSKRESVVPTFALMQFRNQFPQFAEQEMGVYKQQDAEEAFSQLLSCLGSELDIGDLTKVSLNVETKNPISNESKSTTEVAFKLNCYIDIKTNFLRDGLLNGLSDTVEKFNDATQSNTEFQVSKKITSLPKFLTIHFVRFFWRRDTNKKSKILRKVSFPFELDVAEMLDDSIKADKVAIRDKLRLIEKDNSELVRDFKKAKKETGLSPQQQQEEDEMKIESIKSRFQDDYAKLLPEGVDINGLTQNPSSVYDLSCVITHQGMSADSGHYQAFVKDEKDLEGDLWWKFNDNKVSTVNKEKIEALAGGGESDSALILIYRAKGL